MAEFRTMTFPDTPEGQRQKVRALGEASKNGWIVISETITPGQFNGKLACCLAFFYFPCAFCAGSSKNRINVTLQR
jgi:hypothetical protein